MPAHARALRALLLGAAAWLGSLGPAAAEVATDGTLGAKVKLTGKDVKVPARLGQVRGKNLFHSFARFGIETGGRVTFTGPDGLANVIGRVTGGEASSIDGTLASTVPGADLWLLNPAGILFGPNARLEVPGSFHASTADELRFADGAVFSALDAAGSVLSVAEPGAFGFLGSKPGAIAVDRSTLEVPKGEALSLVGGDVTITAGNKGAVGGGAAGVVLAPSGQVTLAALGGPGSTDVNTGEVTGEASAAVRLTNQAVVSTIGDGGGTVRIRGGQLVVENQSLIAAANTGSTDADGGVMIEAGAVKVDSASKITADAFAAGKAGKMTVTAGALEVRNGSSISSTTYATGDAGPVAVTTPGRLLVSRDGAAPFAGIFSWAGPGSTGGNAGPVTVAAGELEVHNGGEISSSTSGVGNGNTVTIDAGRLLVSGDGAATFTNIASRAEPGSGGDAGTVTVRADELEVRNGGEISSGTFTTGDAGTVTIEAGRLLVSGDGAVLPTGIASRAELGSNGNGGTVTITADEIKIHDNGVISSDTDGTGKGGSVNVMAGNLNLLDGSRITTLTTGDNHGGDIGITLSHAVNIANRAFISAATLGNGNAGDVKVTTPRLYLDNGLIAANTGLADITTNRGDAGTVTINAEDVEFANEGRIFNGTYGRGDGGDVFVRADSITIDGTLDHLADNHTGIASSVNASGTGRGGDVTVEARDVTLKGGDRAIISAETHGPGPAGNVAVRASNSLKVASPTSYITSSSTLGATGPSGDVAVRGRDITLQDGGYISTEATGPGPAGNVLVEAERRLRMNRGRITTESANQGGGRIDLRVGDLAELQDNAEITSTVFGGIGTTAGDITINHPRFLVLNDSRILARATAGRGGNIRIKADNILRSPESAIDASAETGISGTVATSTPEVDLSGGVTILPAVFLGAADLLRESCAARHSEGLSSFTAMGRGGLPPDPAGPLAAPYLEERDPAAGDDQPGAAIAPRDKAPAGPRLALAADCGPLPAN
jgi:filamentous hemagglutinin family protein